MSLGARLKEERNRLGFNQSDFAELVGASYKSQLRWEKDESAPGADALSIWAGIGLDVLYVVTGQRSIDLPAGLTIPKMSPEKQELMDAFDHMTPEQRRAILEVGKGLAQSKPSKFAG
ncbi:MULTISPECIES: helix-turn-helix domain-containing protein [Enterobacterales]|uniref:helix-turn-helix domain-containing protein n=1 Tax=Enterobacterales TaxID=91347 RepID=UPI000C13AD63|nr:transcriptional regulator [Serratia marcescens]PHY69822.1 transcriptional regulator [Serratia marcescens]PIC10003.1 transcriptional regulator [Serratia marcescens]HAT2881107.1 transcriptional regulator [Serratia marcescens]HAT2892379.1 transcriptional regulator [Serratia marcescens]HAT2897992.1 transcriptional regulator [Serratia marcescens]